MLFFLLIIPIFRAQSPCAAYTCKLPTDYFSQNTCIFYKTSSAVPTYYAGPCYDLSRSYCPASYQSNSTCTYPPLVSTLKYPGEKCHTSLDCGSYSIGCINHICQGLQYGQKCPSHSFCAPDLRCNITCTTKLNIGDSGCTSDFDCVNTAGCDISNTSTIGNCVKYWSLASFSPVRSCLNYSNWLCQSSTCENLQCVPAYTSTEIPKVCNGNADCGASAQGVQGQCVCGKNRNANQYCSLFFGDPPYLSYFSLVTKWQQSGNAEKCNTVRRFSYVCAGDWWDRKQSYLMNYYYYQSQEYPSLIEFDQCIGEIYLDSFLQTKSLLSNILELNNTATAQFISLVIFTAAAY